VFTSESAGYPLVTMPRPGIISIIYIVIGIFIASDHNYFENVGHFERLISAIIAVLLWPLVLLGADLHLSF
jgi:hypothetical protein